MKPEFLSRGKRLDNGKWVYGYFVESEHDLYNAYIITSAFWETDVDGDTDMISTEMYAVDPNTVGRYTGLTDKNGVRIFEGDIVRYIYEPGSGFWNANQTSVIKWKHTGFRMDGIVGTNKYALMQGWLVSIPCPESAFYVIGNVFDTPELLKGGVV